MVVQSLSACPHFASTCIVAYLFRDPAYTEDQLRYSSFWDWATITLLGFPFIAGHCWISWTVACNKFHIYSFTIYHSNRKWNQNSQDKDCSGRMHFKGSLLHDCWQTTGQALGWNIPLMDGPWWVLTLTKIKQMRDRRWADFLRKIITFFPQWK